MTNTLKRLSLRPKSSLLFVLPVLLSVFIMSKAEAQNIMQIHDASVTSGQQVTVSISIANTAAFVGFQLDIPLPGAFSYVVNSAVLNPARSNGHMFSASLINGNSTLRIISFSINSTPFTGSSGEVANFKLLSGTVPGSYSLTIINGLIADAGSSNIMTSGINGTLTLQAPDIHVSPESHDYGSNPLGTSSDREVSIQNTGNLPLVVTGIDFDSPYFENLGSGSFTLTAGQSTTRMIRFHANVKGTYNNSMSIRSNDPDKAVSTINLQAIAFAVNELHCGDMQAASGTQQTLSLSINNMEAFVGFQFDLSLPAPLSYLTSSALLNPARSSDHQVTVSMVNASTLRVIGFSASNQAFLGNNGTIVSLGFEVDGTGGWYPLSLGSVIIGDEAGDNIVSASYGGGLTITSPDIDANSSINFGNVAVNASSSQNLTINNYGQEALTIDNITFTNPVYSTLNSLPITIEPWNSQQVSIDFQPQTTGQTTGQMRIFSDDPDENPFNVSLSAYAFSPNYLTVSTISASPGTTVTLPISVENYDPFVGFQFDLVLPEGVSYVNSSAVLNPARKQDHNISVSTLQNGALRILAFSMQQLPFLGNEGTIVSLQLTIDESAGLGSFPIAVNNALLGNDDSENILWASNNGELIIEANVDELNLNFGQGYTWFSLNVNPGSMSPASLFTGLTPCYDDRVIGQTSFALYTGSSWIGSLTNLGLDKMYRMKLCNAQNLSLMGEAADLNPINLAAGFTWLGYQPQECQSVSAAMAGLNPGPSYNDRVIGQSSFALYTGTAWIGSLTQLCPGKGYIVKLANAQSLTYPVGTSKGSPVVEAETISPTGVYPVENMQHTMMVMAQLRLPDGSISLNEKDVVYAMIDGVVMGMATPDADTEGMIFLSVGNNTEIAQPITFMVWLDEQQALLPLNETLSFEPLAAIGNLDNPFILTLGEMVGTDELAEGIWIGEPYPNPFYSSTSFAINTNQSGTVSLTIYDALGSLVYQVNDKHINAGQTSITIEKAQLRAGMYHYSIDLSVGKRLSQKTGKLLIQ